MQNKELLANPGDKLEEVVRVKSWRERGGPPVADRRLSVHHFLFRPWGLETPSEGEEAETGAVGQKQLDPVLTKAP